MKTKTRFVPIARLLLLILVSVVLGSNALAEWKEKVLYSFQGGNDGAVPAGGVVFDKAGNLYGATTYTSSCSTTFDCGTVFELSPPQRQGGPWTETTLHVFQGHNQNDGGSPEGGVILDAARNVYGTTAYGGGGPCILFATAVGCGTVYEMISPAHSGGKWTEKLLYSFQGDKDGQFPIGDMVFDKAGNLYGATYYGGGYGSCDSPFYQHCGTIFELIAPKTKGGKWKEKLLYSFKSGKDGANPDGGLIFDNNGAMYGSTHAGGNQICRAAGFVGCGTLFVLEPPTKSGGSWTEEVLHRFRGRPGDGSGPNGGLVFDPKGSVYGTTDGGGNHEGGVVFRLAPPSTRGASWTETLIHVFSGFGDDGGFPAPGLLFDPAGNLYGTALSGKFDGVVYQLKPAQNGEPWSLGVLYNLKGSPDGNHPTASLVFDMAGKSYSTTQWGGTGQACQGGCGTVFEIQQ